MNIVMFFNIGMIVNAAIQSCVVFRNNSLTFYFLYLTQMVLERYFSTSGQGTELLVPKSLVLQDKLIEGPPTDPDFRD